MQKFLGSARKALVPFVAGVGAAVYQAIQSGVKPSQLLYVAAGSLLGLIVHRVPNKDEAAAK